MKPLPQREEALFRAAVQLIGAERAAFVNGACHGDPALRRRLEALLVTDAHSEGVIADPAPAVVATMKLELTEAPDEAVGQKIGRYKILARVGEGGCGVVYVAEQTEPVRRRVALKVIKLGMDTEQVVTRFDAERQVLAMMDHPNIAKVLDAGSTETGRPFFVMELVRGIKITDYCDQNNLSTKERIDLFIKVCQAIQHAHQKGIIHRDIKPSNILVTLHDGVPVPKVIDFGIAKATEGRLTDATVYTQLHQFIGTPAYMSPEQAEMSGLDIDTRSDIYSLGVLLYELLAGSTPFDANELMSKGVDQMRKTIREQEPPRPSTRFAALEGQELTTAAKRRSADKSKLMHQLKGDLDWIVMKCLEKDRTRRYETANGVVADLKRHLENEPVVARPPSQFYRFQKMAKRNKLAVTSTVIVILALLLGVIGTTIGFVRSEKQRRLAERAQLLGQQNFDQARAAVGDLLEASDLELRARPGMQMLRVKLMQKVIDRYKTFLNQPSDDPAPRQELAKLYVNFAFSAEEIGMDYERVCLPAYQNGFAIQQQLVREQPTNRVFRSELGWMYILSQWGVRDDTVIPSHEATIAIFEELLREQPGDPVARADLAWALMEIDWQTAEPGKSALLDRALAIREQLFREYPLSAEFRRDLAFSLQHCSTNSARLHSLSRATDLLTHLERDFESDVPGIRFPPRPTNSQLRPSLIWIRRDLAHGLAQEAAEHARLKHWPAAVATCQRSVEIYHKLVEQNPSMRVFNQELQVAERLLAQIDPRGRDVKINAADEKENAESNRHE